MIERIYHHYLDMEEFCPDGGMWKDNDNKSIFIKKSKDLLCNIERFSETLMNLISNWKNSCGHNLSNISMNRIAWMGQAACYYECKSSEESTRFAWRLLTPEQQKLANSEAMKAILHWENLYAKKI